MNIDILYSTCEFFLNTAKKKNTFLQGKRKRSRARQCESKNAERSDTFFAHFS